MTTDIHTPRFGSSPHTRGALWKLLFGGDGKKDHPRIRGEHPHQPVWWGPHPWIIPAYAGSTPTSQSGGAHTPGSSPHTRGAHGDDGPDEGRHGIIPAYAGSTVGPTPLLLPAGDHPRIRGEHGLLGHAHLSAQGSSPHTRGAQPVPAGVEVPARIIPAYAGSTKEALSPLKQCRDHPRIRGEHSGTASVQVYIAGSSPHTRGARPSASCPPAARRIIPAYAGSTSSIASPTRSARDHPRIRGEHGGVVTIACLRHGSSPHTRGAPPRLEHGHGDRRIIPAYAGSTKACRTAPTSSSDHPRIRGEHLGRNV